MRQNGYLKNFSPAEADQFLKMAAGGGDIKDLELNSVLKNLGKRTMEGKIVKDHNQHISSYFFTHLSETWSQKYENNIMFKPYGSAAEDLKCVEPRDIGDLDLMIFPNAEEMIIHDELIEYSTENPLHVRIKGAFHPVLQSCLVQGTNYLATSALKNFHPVIFGDYLPHLANYVKRALRVASREGIDKCTWELKNSTSSPAVTLNFARSGGSLAEHLVRQKDPKNLDNLDFGEWEWIAEYLCNVRGIDYTREHAKVLEDYFQYANELQLSLKRCGLSGEPRVFPNVVQEMVYSDRAEALKARYRDVDRKTQKEQQRKKLHPVVFQTNQEARDLGKFENEKNEANCSYSVLSGNNGNTNSPASVVCLSTQPTMRNLSEARHDQLMVQENILPREQPNENKSGCSERCNRWEELKTFGKPGRKCETVSAGGSSERQEEEREWEEKIHERWFKHLFENETDAKIDDPRSENESKDTNNSQLQDIEGGFDFVPALRSLGWPKVSQDWITRARKWPSPCVVNEIIQEGFHLIVKPPRKGGNPDCDFRISFSHAEFLLSKEMNEVQRELYRCLKKYHRVYLSTDPKGMVTFHLKNVLLQTIEETGSAMWTDNNRSKCMMKLFRNLHEALKKKNLPHFFVKSFNLFGVDYIERSSILKILSDKVEQIIANPTQFGKELLQRQKNAAIVSRKADCIAAIASTKPMSSTKTRQALEQEAHSNRKLQTTNQGSIIPPSSLRYHDLKDFFFATVKELIVFAFDDSESNIKALVPLERSLVEELREITQRHNLPREVLPMMFEDECWEMAYGKIWISSEPNMKLRILDGIQGVIKTWKYILEQPDFGIGNEEAIFRRMVDPASKNPFDLNHVLPAGAGTLYLNRFVNSVKARRSYTKVMDVIPLD